MRLGHSVELVQPLAHWNEHELPPPHEVMHSSKHS